MDTILEQKSAGTREIIDDILKNLTNTNRNLVSDEFEDGLKFLSKYIDLNIHRYKSGSECWTWTIPQKWKMRRAYIKKDCETIVSADDHPLHVMSYSIPVHKVMKGAELREHIFIHNELPDAIPYEFSFYIPKWGFCLTHRQAAKIEDDVEYEVVIDSEFTDDYLSVGEYIINGSSDEHIFLLSHMDHPFQANDGVVGVATNVALAKLLEQQKSNYYNYTFLFVPETIGSIAFLSHNEHLISNIRYSIFSEMVGLNNPLIIQKSLKDSDLINEYAEYVLIKKQGEAKSYPFLTVAGNDEKVFDSPGVNIPSLSITRVNQESKLEKKADNATGLVYPYPQYHTHLDDLSLVCPDAVYNAVDALYELCQVIEKDYIPKRKFKGPVFLTKFGLWIDWRTDLKMSEKLMWMMYMLEGDKTVFQIAKELDIEFEFLVELLDKFHDKLLITKERIPVEFDRTC